mmetsp:Transcript_32528/g.78943  ORF Transcript_32528/g.78943 Transcript_32528/m.78943 type:complete len:811 (+) Transcript_32528:49-2481(+)
MTDATPQWAAPPGQQQHSQQQAQQRPGYAAQPPAAQPAPTAPPQAPASGGAAVVSPPPSAGAPRVNKFNRIAQMEEKVLVTRTRDEETEDGRLVNKEAMTKIRDAWVYKRVRSRVREFTSYRQALCFVGTWNVNAKGKEESLDEWICADWGQNGQYAPDVVAVGFQEIVDLNAVNVAVDNKTQQRSQFWVERLNATLNSPSRTQNDPNRGYVLMMQRSMVGLLICLFVKNPHRQRVKAVSADSVGVGVMGMMGNKGGVAIRLNFYDSTLCFVCTHLAAHRENVVGRNADFMNVLSKATFDVGEETVRENIRNGSLSQWALGSGSLGVADHDIVFWLGDLNYRIDESLPTETVLLLAERGAIDKLRPLDQLNIERSEGRVFEGFQEGILNFVPTYKYQPGTETFEQRPDKKLRAPAWCDRILWSAQEPAYVQQLTYKRSERPNCSDHKPVYSTLRFTVKDVNAQRREGIYKELFALLERYDNRSLPAISLDKSELDFGEVRYNQSVTLSLRIANTGPSCASYRFVPKMDESILCKPWMSVFPTYGMLVPGEQPGVVTVTVTIDNNTAKLLNAGREVLKDTLILRLENGREYYVSIKGTFARSCFGMSLDQLVLYKDPIRTIALDAIQRAEQFPNENEVSPSNALCIPKELWRLVDAMYEKGLSTPDLFTNHGNPEEVEQIREALDTGSAFGVFSIHSYAEAFTSFLTSLSSPVIPATVFPNTEINAENIQAMTRRLLEELPPIHYNVLVYIISFFREVLLHSEKNHLTAAKLAHICLKHCAPADVVMDSAMMQRRAGMSLILIHLLVTSSI